MKSASASSEKYATRAGNASVDYVQGAETTSKDQAQAAIAGKDNYVKGVQESIARGGYEKGLAKSGKTGWLDGVKKKGSLRYSDGVREGAGKYATNSGKFDGARGAANNLPRGPKGSETNFARSKAVGQALRAVKVGK